MAVKIAILHYHLRPGGVATVIRNAQRALAGKFEVQILADFGYDEHPARSRAVFVAESSRLAERIAKRLRGVDVLHTHNVGLGKHPRLTYAVKLLAEQRRIKIINQVHDFPEDDRPAQLSALRNCAGKRDDAFQRTLCYYDAPNMIWATLTTHDAAKLATHGVPAGKIHVLPNPVDEEFFTQPAPSRAELQSVRAQLAAFAHAHRFLFDPRKKLLLSPMKVMVRKNNAEAVELVKRLEQYQLVISLDASSARDRDYSERLKKKIRRERLPVVIGFGAALDNSQPLFHLAHAVLTTSEVEGFGYTFVEGWLCHRSVVGRDIPEVTRDFVTAGMKMGHFYRTFDNEAVRRLADFLARPPRKLIEDNRKIVLKEYSLRAYARRYEKLLRKFPRGGVLGAFDQVV
ncbi:MAG TPA: glycosyltransferase family 4 protein [Verrucomicrobiae bacterium]|nr:glycosyltransferase family 4 protein [Verrucomicrobiae bacterium]